MNEKIKEEVKKLYDEGQKLLDDYIDDKEGKNRPKLRKRYQSWYTKALIVVKELLPDRYNEFIECYSSSKRKEVSYATFTMSDYLLGISKTIGGRRLFDPRTAGLVRFATQVDIIKSICENMGNVLFDIKSNIEIEILDNELLCANKLLKKGYIRSAGAICGVVLEKHFATVLSNHNLNISKKEPTISDFNDLFKQESVYDVVNWRFIQHLGDIRNLCDHNKDREPTRDEVQELIDGTDKVIKTIF